MKIMICLALILCACTGQERARVWGGTESLKLQPNEKLVLVTWKENNLWILTRPMKPEENAETYTFGESSAWGVAEGKVIIKETK